MATLLGPFSVGYPVAFRSGGDTTREAFGKHIQEIERIYGILNVLDAGKVSTADLTSVINGNLDAHIQSTNPHPNWKIDLSNTTGDLDASRVVGTLTRANIDASHINNLSSVIAPIVQGLIPGTQPDKGDGIVSSNLTSNGYAIFNNGLTLQWGLTNVNSNKIEQTTSFPISFTSQCFAVVGSLYLDSQNPVTAGNDTVRILSWKQTSFTWVAHCGGICPIVYFAIGI